VSLNEELAAGVRQRTFPIMTRLSSVLPSRRRECGTWQIPGRDYALFIIIGIIAALRSGKSWAARGGERA